MLWNKDLSLVLF